MNAAEQVRNYTTASKIGAIANLFKSKFPAATIDLKPWLNSSDIWDLLDPNSLDLGFHFPGISRLMQARSILFQIRLHQFPHEEQGTVLVKAVGIDALGYNYRGQCWRFSTIADWTFTGETAPIADGKAEFKDFCSQVLSLFNYCPL
jgi:hypothetical protein